MDGTHRVKTKNDIIRSLLRGLRILELLAAHPEGMNPKQIALASDLHLSTCYHLLNTLQVAGYVIRNPDTQLLQLSGKIGYAIHGTLSPAQLVKQISPHVHALQQATLETAYFSLWDGEEIVLASIAESPLSVRVQALTIGYDRDAHAMALGKAILAYLPGPVAEHYCLRRGLPRLTANTITELDALNRCLIETRMRGYSLDHEEFLPEVCCIGAPVFDARRQIVGALAISLPAARYQRHAGDLIPKVVEAGQAATRALEILGYAWVS